MANVQMWEHKLRVQALSELRAEKKLKADSKVKS